MRTRGGTARTGARLAVLPLPAPTRGGDWLGARTDPLVLLDPDGAPEGAWPGRATPFESILAGGALAPGP